MCFTWPNLEALVSENEPPRSLARRVGIYNVVWAATGAVAYSAGGWLIANLGHASLYWVPVLIHATQFAATWPLRRRYDQTRESTQAALAAHAAASELEPHHPTVPKPKYFKALGWAANPFSYMAINTLLVLVPGLARKLGLSMAEAGLLMSVWYHARTAAFVVLWLWPGWHYRFSWFAGAFALLFGSFLAMMTTQSIAILLLAQLGFGWATALIYYSYLYYAMDGTETHGTHGGIHEALVGIGICGGPAVSATAFWLSGNPQSPTWAMAGILALGGALVFRVRGRPVRLA
jgi:predicted MFS family arabinose efflux permease